MLALQGNVKTSHAVLYFLDEGIDTSLKDGSKWKQIIQDNVKQREGWAMFICLATYLFTTHLPRPPNHSAETPPECICFSPWVYLSTHTQFSSRES